MRQPKKSEEQNNAVKLGVSLESIVEESPNRVLGGFTMPLEQPRLIRYDDGEGNTIYAGVSEIEFQEVQFVSQQRDTHGDIENGNNVMLKVHRAVLGEDGNPKLLNTKGPELKIPAVEVDPSAPLDPMVGRVYWSFRTGFASDQDVLVLLSWGNNHHFPQKSYDVKAKVTNQVTDTRKAVDWTSETGNANWEQYILQPLNSYKLLPEADQEIIKHFIDNHINTTANAPSRVREREAAASAPKPTPVQTVVAQVPTGQAALAAAAAADEE